MNYSAGSFTKISFAKGNHCMSRQKQEKTAKDKDWMTAAACARLEGISRATMCEQLRKVGAPSPDNEGRYHYPTIKAWRSTFAHTTNETAPTKELILQEDLKLKRLRVGKAAGDLLPIGEVADLMVELVGLVKEFQAFHEELEDDPRKKQRIRERGRAHFQGVMGKIEGLIQQGYEGAGDI